MRRKGLTLLEVIVAMACMGVLVVTMHKILASTTVSTISGVTNVKAQEETKQITENIEQIIMTSTYVEILDEVPNNKDDKYKYIYSKDGVVYYYDGVEENEIDVNEEMQNTVYFSAHKESHIMDYRIVSELRNVKGDYATSINLRNIDDYVVDSTTDGEGHCIKFKNQRDIALITKFGFKESYNNAYGISEDIKGSIFNKIITVTVPNGTDVTALRPSAKFFGDYVYVSQEETLTDDEVKSHVDSAEKESSDYTVDELLNTGKDFSTKQYYYVVCGDLVVKYTVIVKVLEPESGIKIVQSDSEDIIWYNKNFIAELEAPQSGHYYWYVEGINECIWTDITNELPVKTLIEYDKNNGDEKIYELGNANQYEDVMRWITVKFVPDSMSDGNSAPVETGGMLADPVFVYTEPYDFYSKVATDVWIQTIKNPTDAWLTGVDTVDTYKELYKTSTGKEYDHNATYVNKNDNQYYDDAPEFIKVLYSVDPITLEFKPYIMSMDDKATLSGDKGYAKTIFGVDLEYYKSKIDNTVVSDIDSYNVKVEFAATNLNKVVGKTITTKETKNLYKASIGVFNEREEYTIGYDGTVVDALKGFRTVTGAKIRSTDKVGMKIMNYSDAAENNIMNIPTKPKKLLEQYIASGSFQSMSPSAAPNKFVLELQTQRQNNGQDSIIYYGRLDNKEARTGSSGVPVGYVTFKEDLNDGTSGEGEAMGLSQTFDDTVLLFGDNYNTMNQEDLVDNSDDDSGYGKYKTVTRGNYISVGTSGDGLNASNIICASYITDMNVSDGFEELKVNANVLGHTTVTGMADDIEHATILELEFDKPIRSGYDYRLYEDDTVTLANIDTGITGLLTSSIGKNIGISVLEKSDRRPSRKQTDQTTPNMLVGGINIEDSRGTKYKVLTNDSAGIQYAYKTGENKIVVLLDKPLTEGNIYDISFERGAVRALIGGDIEIKPTTVEGKEIAVSSGALFDMSVDIYTDGGEFNSSNGEEFGHREPNGYTADKYTLWGNMQYYLRENIPTFKMVDNKFTKLSNNFNIGATSMKAVGFKQGGARVGGSSNRFEAYGVFDGSNGNGYVMVVTDIMHWSESATVNGKSQLGILCIKNRNVVDTNSGVLDGSAYGWNDDYYIGGMNNRVYFVREKDKFYTFNARFSPNSVTLEVLDENGNAMDLVNINGSSVGKSYTVPLGPGQIVTDELDTVLIQSGSEYTYFAPSGNFVISE